MMMDLAGIVPSKEKGGKPNGALGYDVAKKYENAKLQFIHSGIDSLVHDSGLGGMRDAHLPISYYLIANNL
jgi:hypothetical protein